MPGGVPPDAGDLVGRVCPHPMLRMLSLYSIPQIPPKSVDFTTFSWPALTKRIRQMVVTGARACCNHQPSQPSAICYLPSTISIQ